MMNKQKSPGLYMHIGLHKTATSYLQYCVFPFWPGVQYLGRPYSNKVFELGVSSFSDVVLVSNEQFSGRPIGELLNAGEETLHDHRSRCISRLKSLFPDAGIILGFREHGSYIVSLYNNYIRYGGVRKINDFWDSDSEKTVIGADDLLFKNVITQVDDLWENVFIYDQKEIARDSDAFYKKLASFIGVSSLPERKKGMVNKSPSFARLNVIRRLNNLPLYTGPKKHIVSKELYTKFAGAIPFPRLFVRGNPDEQVQLTINNANKFYKDDWKYVQRKIKDKRAEL